jgi:amino acid permease
MNIEDSTQGQDGELLPVDGVDNQEFDGNVGTIAKGTLTMVHTSIGAGLIAMPFAFSCLGVLHGLLWSVMSAWMSGFSLYCMAYVGVFMRVPETSFYRVGKIFGLKTFRLVVDLAIAFQGWGVCVSYLILIGNALPALVRAAIGCNQATSTGCLFINQYSWVGSCLIMVFLLYPLSLKRSLGSLWIASYLAIISIAYIILVVIGYFTLYVIEWKDLVSFTVSKDPNNHYHHLPILYFKWSFADMIRGIPILIFGLTCHQNLFKVFNELANHCKVMAAMRKLVSRSVLIVVGIYVTVAIMGYITLGGGLSMGSDGGQLFERYEKDKIFGKILAKYDPHHVSLHLARLALMILVMTAFPLQLHPARDAWGNIFKRRHIWYEAFKKRGGWRRLFRSVNSAPLDARADSDEDEMLICVPRDQDDEHEPLLYRVAGLSADELTPMERADEEFEGNLWIKMRSLIQKKINQTFGTTLYCSSCLIVSLILPDFSKVLGLVGALGANPIALFFGPYMYVRLCKFAIPQNEDTSHEVELEYSRIQSNETLPDFNSDKASGWKYYMAWFNMVFSLALMVTVLSHEATNWLVA